MREIEVMNEYYARYFHEWYRLENGKVKAIVEYEDGNVRLIEPYLIKFIDCNRNNGVRA